jgi:DNA-directed RNA polymerase specialized sigma24 family protein
VAGDRLLATGRRRGRAARARPSWGFGMGSVRLHRRLTRAGAQPRDAGRALSRPRVVSDASVAPSRCSDQGLADLVRIAEGSVAATLAARGLGQPGRSLAALALSRALAARADAEERLHRSVAGPGRSEAANDRVVDALTRADWRLGDPVHFARSVAKLAAKGPAHAPEEPVADPEALLEDRGAAAAWPESPDGLDETLDASRRSEALKPLLSLLSPLEREVLHWSLIEQLPWKEVATRCGATVGVVRSAQQRALWMLRHPVVADTPFLA